jgi:hypothetical protein
VAKWWAGNNGNGAILAGAFHIAAYQRDNGVKQVSDELVLEIAERTVSAGDRARHCSH